MATICLIAMRTLAELRGREADLTNRTIDLQEKQDEHTEEPEDLLQERSAVRERIAEEETALERAEQEHVAERW